MAQDPQLRAPTTWEVSRPFPPPETSSFANDRRIKTVARLLRQLEKLTPGFQSIHAIGAELPQECVYLLASSFFSEQFCYMYQVPRYRDWLLQQDMTQAYQWHKQFLQHLQCEMPNRRWLLKAPGHLANLNTLAATYPDATIIWTHRKPIESIASFSSLTNSLRGGFSDDIDAQATGRHELEHFSKVMEKGMASRTNAASRKHANPIVDASFTEICQHPITVIEMIYQQLDMHLSMATKDHMHRYLQQRPADLYGKHRYTAQDFGLDEAPVATLFDGYMTQFEKFL